MVDSQELDHFRDLLKDFAAEPGIDPLAALKFIQLRYSELSKDLFQHLIPRISNIPMDLPKLFETFARTFHKYLFQDFFRNAGRYRRQSDPGGGRIHFGPYNPRTGKTAHFAGTAPDKITGELRKLYMSLSAHDPDPTGTAIIFYLGFVAVHPFYDANGRIARLLVSIYLGYHGKSVMWKPLDHDQKMKFIKLLNDCHKATGLPHRDHKLKNLINFWKDYVIPLENLA